jgi:cell division septation protein DedD
VAEAPTNGVVDAQVRQMPMSVMSILGKRVQGPGGEDLGRVVDVLADAGGRVRVAIVDFGGFLGVGDRRIAVDWPLLRFNPSDGETSLLLSVSRDKLKSAPEYKQTARPQILMEPTPPAQAQPPAQGQPAQGQPTQAQPTQGQPTQTPPAQGQAAQAPSPAQPASPPASAPASAAAADSKK